MPAVLKPRLLQGIGATVTGDGGEPTRARAHELGAHAGPGVLIHHAPEPADADGVRAALDGAWDAIRAHALPPESSTRLVILVAPPPGDPHHAAARAGLENLARTLSIEWSRYGTRTVAILPGERTTPGEVAELAAFLASRAGAYYSGCALSLR